MGKTLERIPAKIFRDTKGHPIMVRYSVLQEGIEAHAKNIYRYYLIDTRKDNIPNVKKIKAFIICSLFNISSVPITSDILQEIGCYESALDLKGTIIRESNDEWNTIHPRWDLELLKYIFSLKLEKHLNYIKGIFAESINNILDQDIGGLNKINILYSVYNTIAIKKFISFNVIEKLVNYEDIKSKLDEESKVRFLATVLVPAYISLERNKQALNYIDQALAINPNMSYVVYNKGLLLNKTEHHQQAIECFDQVLAIDPEHVSAIHAKGVALFRLKKYQQAIECFDQAIAFDPDRINILHTRGVALFRLKKYQQAIECFDQVLAIDPNHSYTLNTKGWTLGQIGEYKGAIKYLDRALAIDPKSERTLHSKGWVLTKLGENVEALKFFDKALEINPKHKPSIEDKSNILKKIKTSSSVQ